MLYYYEKNFRKDFSILKAKANSRGELDYTKVDPSQIDLNEKSIIILCGNNSKSLRRAEFYAHLCRSWLAKSKHQTDFSTYSVYYPNNQPLFNENANIKLDYKGLAQEIFKQVLYKGNKLQSVEEIIKNLSNIVFFGHSAGGLVMNELMHCFEEMLIHINLAKADIEKIYNSIIFIGYAPYDLVDAPINTVYVAPVHDTVGSLKLVYNGMLKNKDFVSPDSNIDIFGENKLSTRGRLKFIKQYKERMDGKEILYFVNKNSLIATPNLLYFDGKKEDHNFAGAVKYSFNNPYQTKAGKLTAKFLSNTFEYCLSTQHADFSINDLYNQAIKTKAKSNTTQEETIQERTI